MIRRIVATSIDWFQCAALLSKAWEIQGGRLGGANNVRRLVPDSMEKESTLAIYFVLTLVGT